MSTSPLKQDPELKEMLAQLDSVRTARTFKRWKNSFLTRWEEFLEQANIGCADKAYKEFAVSMGQLVKLMTAVNEYVDKEELSCIERMSRHAIRSMK
jgi:hypothetical protein